MVIAQDHGNAIVTKVGEECCATKVNTNKTFDIPSTLDFISELNHCEKNPGICQNDAKCISLTKDEGSYRCMCRDGTSGKNCEISEHSTTAKPHKEEKTTVKNTENTTESKEVVKKKSEVIVEGFNKKSTKKTVFITTSLIKDIDNEA